MEDFFKRLNEECGVRLPLQNDQDWEMCAGDYKHTNDYIEFYNVYSISMDKLQKELLINMIVQGIEDLMNYSQDKAYIDMLWDKAKEILLTDNHTSVIEYWSCIGQELEDCWLVTPIMRDLL